MPPKQKPNDACACGSGAKHKRCCGKALGEQRAIEVSTEVASLKRSFFSQSTSAFDAESAGNLPKAAALMRSALETCVMLGPAGLGDAVCTLTWLVEYCSKLGELVKAEDAAQRALFILTPPHTLHLQSLLDLSRADWRCPLGAGEVKVTIPPAAMLRALEQSPMHKCLELARAHVLIELACAHSRAFHSARALEVCGQAGAAMGDAPRSPRRILLESKVQEISGNQFLREREVVRSRACYTEAMRLLDEAVAAGADKNEVAGSRASLELNSQLLSKQEGTSQSPEAQLLGFERIWAAFNGECSETARSTCRNALLCCVTVDQQRVWLQRYLSMSPEAAAVSPAVRLTGQTAARGVCRGCRKTAAACSAEGDKLRICSGCSGVAYCSSSCQADDWKRHAAACKSAARFARKADAGSDAALSEALCCECQLPASAELLTILKCGHLLHRFCASRLEEAAMNRPLMERVAACCPTCDTPFIAPLAPRTTNESGVPDVICDPAGMAGGTALSLDDMARSAGWDSMPQMQGKSHEERVAVMRSWGILGMQVGVDI